MALINEIIPQQGFEIVLNRLGAILLVEVSNQITLQSLNDELGIYVERQENYDKSEGVVINVRLSNITFNGQTQAGSQGEAIYYIDIYTQGDNGVTMSAYTEAKLLMMRYLGMVRYILSSTKYKTLDYPMTGFIGGVNVQTIQQDLNYGVEDANYARMSRLQVSIRINEMQELWESSPFEGMDSTFKLNLTEKGFKLTFNNS